MQTLSIQHEAAPSLWRRYWQPPPPPLPRVSWYTWPPAKQLKINPGPALAQYCANAAGVGTILSQRWAGIPWIETLQGHCHIPQASEGFLPTVHRSQRMRCTAGSMSQALARRRSNDVLWISSKRGHWHNLGLVLDQHWDSIGPAITYNVLCFLCIMRESDIRFP